MARVLGISGSPRREGNTALLLDEALRSIATRAETRVVRLADGAPPPEAVVLEMEAADAIVFATPSYFALPSAELKRVMDASRDAWKRRALTGKPAAVLAVEATDGGELAAAAIGHFAVMHRMVYLGAVVGRGQKEREILYDIKAIRESRELANRVVDYLERK